MTLKKERMFLSYYQQYRCHRHHDHRHHYHGHLKMLGSFRGEEGDVGELLHLDLVLQVLNVVTFGYHNFSVRSMYVKCMSSVS